MVSSNIWALLEKFVQECWHTTLYGRNHYRIELAVASTTGVVLRQHARGIS